MFINYTGVCVINLAMVHIFSNSEVNHNLILLHQSNIDCRNQVFRVLFGTMMVLGHIEFILDIVPMLYRFVPDENHVIIPIFLVFLNLFFYHKCCMEDPGVINAKTVDRYKNVYPYDGRMFKSGVTCVTCHLEKPARSKHCSKFSLRTHWEETLA